MTERYLRNRLRRLVYRLLDDDSTVRLQELRRQQIALRTEIDRQTAAFLKRDHRYERYLFITIDPMVASELLRAAVHATGSLGPTRPQLQRTILAIKTAKPGSHYDIAAGVRLVFDRRTFTIQTS